MSIPRVNSCCFCFSLSTGTLVIGYLYSVIAIIELFMYTMIVTLRPLGSAEGGLSAHKFTFFIVIAVISFIQLLCGILLIVGATTNRAFLTLPWTMVTGILALIFVILCLTAASMILQDPEDLLGGESAMILFQFVRACISIYCITVVHSRHKQIMADKNERRFMHSARLLKRSRTIE